MDTTRTPKQRARRAYLVTDVVGVCCPFCGDAQPNPTDGSEQWQRSDFEKVTGSKPCVSCDAPILITPDPKATFQ